MAEQVVEKGSSHKPSRKLLTLADQIRMCPSFRNVKTVERLLASGPLNDFALWDLEGEACGCGFFPGAALINHSCVPSSAVQLEGTDLCFYATMDIEEGAEITQSYANLNGDGRYTRQENLTNSWDFVCKCIRCEYEKRIQENPVGTALEALKQKKDFIESFDRLHVCSCGGVSCPPSRRGSRPLPPGETEGACNCNCFNLVTDV